MQIKFRDIIEMLGLSRHYYVPLVLPSSAEVEALGKEGKAYLLVTVSHTSYPIIMHYIATLSFTKEV